MSLDALLKAAHIGGLILWMAGLLVLPSLYRGRMRLTERTEAFHEWHRLTRAVFVRVTSPAAFVAIGTGAGLIFVREVFVEWMYLKLAAVGLLVMLHVWAGHVNLDVLPPELMRPGGLQSLAPIIVPMP